MTTLRQGGDAGAERACRRGAAPAARVAGLVAALLLAAAGAQAAPVNVRDDGGQVLTLPAPARRVVAVSPHLAEMVFAAGGGDRLVGVMRYSDFPPEAARLPVIGDAFAVNLEAVAALKPDLLLVWRSGVNPRQQQRLRTLGVPVYESETTSVEGIADTLRRLGRLLGTEPAAEAAAAQTETAWAQLRARHAGRPPVRVFYQLWHEPLMTVNQGHLIDQAIRACGGVNVFAQQPGLTPTVSWEAAVATNPQVVVTGAARDEPPHLEGWQRFSRVEAVQQHRLKVLDGHRLARMTPRFVEGAQALCSAIDSAR
ncbi:cobalamin-binding protein [Ideonella sp. A 288]|uniref:cobalamin-binding protein n=1 Tax=Ideonella sp. A 288 TaxID=1962181 RepID=UPI000B4A66C5|nr:cobalamin-binding protein [Ideonella sp. A 288]